MAVVARRSTCATDHPRGAGGTPVRRAERSSPHSYRGESWRVLLRFLSASRSPQANHLWTVARHRPGRALKLPAQSRVHRGTSPKTEGTPGSAMPARGPGVVFHRPGGMEVDAREGVARARQIVQERDER